MWHIIQGRIPASLFPLNNKKRSISNKNGFLLKKFSFVLTFILEKSAKKKNKKNRRRAQALEKRKLSVESNIQSKKPRINEESDRNAIKYENNLF